MKTIICKICNFEFEVDESKVNEEYIQCPNCGNITKNPLIE